MRGLIVLMLVAVATPAAVYAQPADVPALIKLIENQPNDMDRSTWKEKRRDAARKLSQSKDKRAVPVLINLADTETFDIIGDIAIEGLGTLKDQSAVPVLQRIVGDVSRDKSSRELARKALAKLGAPETGGGATTGGGTTGAGSGSATTGPKPGGGTTGGTTTTGPKPGGGTTGAGSGSATTTGPKPGGGTTGTGTTGGAVTTGPKTGGGATGGGSTGVSGGGAVAGPKTDGGDSGLEGGGSLSGAGGAGGSLIGDKQGSDVEGQPELADDVIAASDRLTIAAGTAGLAYDTARKRVDFDANASGLYGKRVEAETRAWGFNLGTDVVAGATNPDGRGVTRALVLNAHGDGEARFYSNQLYGVGKAAVGFGIQQLSYRHPTDPNQDLVGSDARFFTADLQIALGGGYGRVVDVGSAIRVARLGRTLDNARALGKPIDAATSRKLQLTWWALRGERSSFRSLIATIAVLREAGILLGEPNAVITYEILQVLRDSQLYMRPSGFDVQLVFGEGYLQRPDQNDDGFCDLGSSRCGRYEQVIASAGYGAQIDEDKVELSGTAYARYRLFPGDGEPAPWAAGATARMRRFIYGDHGDPFGALDVRGTLAVSADADPEEPCMGGGCDKSLRIEGELGFTYWLNQASGLRLAAHLAEDAGEIFFGARLEATYGLLDGTFAR
jgi:hypothetical protein